MSAERLEAIRERLWKAQTGRELPYPQPHEDIAWLLERVDALEAQTDCVPCEGCEGTGFRGAPGPRRTVCDLCEGTGRRHR